MPAPTDGLPPGPQGPTAFEAYRWVYRPTETLESCQRRYGGTFTLRIPGGPPVVLLSEPEAIRDIFVGDPHRFSTANEMLRPLLGDRSLFLLSGQAHLNERRVLMPAFHGERMHVYGAVISELASRAIDRWPLGRRFSFHHCAQELTLDIILRLVLGQTEGPAYARLRGCLERFLGVVSSPTAMLFSRPHGRVPLREVQESLGRLSPWGYVSHRMRELDELLLAEISRRRGQPAGEDILSLMLEARDESGKPLDDQALRDELLTFVLAGHETAAAVLSTTVYQLLAHPEVLSQARDERMKAFGDAACEPRRVAELRYLDAVIKEAMRIHPVVPGVMRRLDVPLRLAGREYPAGVFLVPCSYLVHRRPELWPEPERFEPRRFLEAKPSLATYFPFGGGVRHCIGMSFALYEIKLVLAELLRRASLHLVPGYRPRMVWRGPTFVLSEGVPVQLEARVPRAAPGSAGRPSSEAGTQPSGVGRFWVSERGRRWARKITHGFQASLHGAEHLPQAGAALFVSNHAYGGLDASLLSLHLAARLGRAPYFIADHSFFRWPLQARLAYASGVVPGTPDRLFMLLSSGQLALVFPGGTDEAFKLSSEAYTLKWRQRSGFARAAMRARVPIIPVATTGTDEIFRIPARERWIGRRLFGSPRYDLPLVTGISPVPIDFHVLAPIDTAGDPDNEADVERVRRATKEAIDFVLAAHREKRA